MTKLFPPYDRISELICTGQYAPAMECLIEEIDVVLFSELKTMLARAIQTDGCYAIQAGPRVFARTRMSREWAEAVMTLLESGRVVLQANYRRPLRPSRSLDFCFRMADRAIPKLVVPFEDLKLVYADSEGVHAA